MERIHVTVRARPLSPEDAKTTPWRVSGNSILYSNQPSKFEFDQIFGQDCKTREVYEARTKDIVGAAVRGFNGTVFAYGQTNSGKTHTMRGSVSEPGVIPLSVRDLFDSIQEETGREFLLRMSYMEIYNEEINDLLAPEHRKLQIHESIERGIYVAGLREEIVASPEQVLELMQSGESHRHIGETNMNLYSSRSHTIFRMIIESRERSEDEDGGNSCDAVRVSVLNLVDLAGSERAAKTGAEGVRLKEGSHINKSLMTLGTVIKKLSEGAESQGGHVPYRDSKLTRILQPALGGNANTAIICNITLAQIHADETKSSLQFASRALRVTNCAYVNEILTDAALLKRQKKEIEELKAKLQGPHSEHFTEEILNLRNTLLKTELERERIALELEEEKKAQTEREKRLQEQAKKIENLSSMVLYSNRDENCDLPKKDKRRDTWCFGKISRETLRELNLTVGAKDSAAKPVRSESDAGLLFPFEELANEVNMDNCSKPEEERTNIKEDFNLPNPRALLHVTSRRKGPPKKKSLLAENSKLDELQAEYEDLLLKFETQRTMSEIQVDFLTRKLAATELCLDEKANACATHYCNESIVHEEEFKETRESEAILVIKQLQEKINNIEMEKCSSQQNLDSVVELATEQTLCAMEKYEKLYRELLDTREEARIACEQLASIDYDGYFDSVIKLSMEVEELTSEAEKAKSLSDSVSLVVDELWQSLSALLNLFSEFKHLSSNNSAQLKSVITDHEKLRSYMSHKVNDLEHEKLLLHNQSLDLHHQIQELNLNVQQLEKTSAKLLEQHDLETTELLVHIQALEKEILCLSSSSLAREKEGLRKELDKTKSKLKETDSKLKNIIQEKTKLEGGKACAERELKKLHSQKALLQRDISKRESLAGRRRDSLFDSSSNVFDPKRSKGLSAPCDQNFQEEYRKLEVLAFEMETTIASLEEELAAANEEKQVAISKVECLSANLQDLSTQLSISNSELNSLQEEKSRLEESLSLNQRIESSIQVLVEEKEELAMQLAEALLGIEEEKAIWSSKEKASLEAIEERTKSHNSEILLLRKRMSEVTNELASAREECKHLGERLTCTENNIETEKECSLEKVLEIERLQNELRLIDDKSTRSQETLKSKLQMLASENHQAWKEVEMLRLELSVLNKERNDLLNQVLQLEKEPVLTGDSELLKAKAELDKLSGRLSCLELKMHNDQVSNGKDKAKLRMRLRGTQATCDAFGLRYKEVVEEVDLMNKKYEEAAGKLKSQLASYAKEVLNLRKQLSNVNTATQ